MKGLSRTIQALEKLGEYILNEPSELQDIKQIAFQHNGWFDINNINHALQAIAQQYLHASALETFANNYQLSEPKLIKNIGLILAGNIPLVGFHDIICVLLSGNNAIIKMSSKDNKLTRALLMKLIQFEPSFTSRIKIVEQLKDFDAVIATGSNNSARYFEQYFGKYPNIIRKNRTSIAVLDGNETEEDYQNLGRDVFDYYGLGCRSVSFLFVPKGYDFNPLLNRFNDFQSALSNQKYKNNFDYNLTLLLVNKIPFFQGESILVTEDKSLHSRIGVLHYKEYETKDELNNFIIEHQNEIQVVVGREFTPFGNSQQPSLHDFADRIDTMKFLTEL